MISKNKKRIQVLLFVVIMGFTFYAVFHKQDLPTIWDSICKMSWVSILVAIALSIFFASAEGIMMWYLLRSMGNKCRMGQCLRYSWVGFFYSGITPSATGGQPMQLYYMNKDGWKASQSTVILMTMALAYKLVLVLVGTTMLIVWYQPLKSYMGNTVLLYFLGIVLNLGVILVIIGAMAFPNILIQVANWFEVLLIRAHIWKPKEGRKAKVKEFVGQYRQAVGFMAGHKSRILVVMFITALQRFSMFLLTYVIYKGFYLAGENVWKIMELQAAVTISVDMLPVPGAQGITEIVYQAVFGNIFTEEYLVPSMLVNRGINFYFLLVFCGIVAALAAIKVKKYGD